MAQFNPFDSDSVLQEVGPIVPIILREAMDSGFDAYRRSRDLDPAGHVDYRATTRANMLVDRIYPFLEDLVRTADPSGSLLRTRTTDNGRATELYSGRDLCAKIKRIRDRVRTPAEDLEVEEAIGFEVFETGLPQNVKTARVLKQLDPYGFAERQLLLPYVPPVQVPDDGRERLCLIASFDLDLLEVRLERPRLGLYDSKRAIWTHALPDLPLETITSISPQLADRVDALRRLRTA